MGYTVGFLLFAALRLGCSLDILIMGPLKASDREEASAQLQLPGYNWSAALQQESPGLSDQRPLAAHGAPPGGSSRAEDWAQTSTRR